MSKEKKEKRKISRAEIDKIVGEVAAHAAAFGAALKQFNAVIRKERPKHEKQTKRIGDKSSPAKKKSTATKNRSVSEDGGV